MWTVLGERLQHCIWIQLITLLSLPLSLFNLMSQIDLLDILMSQVLPHGLTRELSKESYCGFPPYFIKWTFDVTKRFE